MKNIFYPAFLILILLFHLINNYIILTEDTLPLAGDEVAYFMSSLAIKKFIINHHHIKNFERMNTFIKEINQMYIHIGGRCRPPLFMLTITFFYRFLTLPPDDAVVMSNILYFIILLFSVYGIGKTLFDKDIGIFSAFILSMFPGIFGMSRQIHVDFALTAMVSFSIYAFLLTDNFGNRKYSILFGASIGLGLLTKTTYPLFIFMPTFYYWRISAKHLITDNLSLCKRKKNLYISLSIGILLASSWYLPNLIIVLQRAIFCSTYTPFFSEFKFIPWFIYYITFYIQALVNNHLFPIYSALFVISLIFFLNDFKKEKKFIFIWFLIPLIAFLLSPNRIPRYILSVLPAIALIIATEIIYLRKLTIINIIVFAFFQYFIMSYLPYINSKFITNHKSDSGLLYASKVDWKTKEIIDIIDINRKSNSIITNVLSIPIIDEVHLPIKYISELQGLRIYVDCPVYIDNFRILKSIDYNAKIFNCDFLITKTGNLGGFGIWRDCIGKLVIAFEKYKHNFDLVGTINNLPDGSRLYIYKNKIKNI